MEQIVDVFDNHIYGYKVNYVRNDNIVGGNK